MGQLTGKRVLVTGAAGFIGSHVTEALLREGAEVSCLIRYNSASSWGFLDTLETEARRNLRIFAGTVEDSDFVRHAMEGQQIVLHLAALIAIPYSYKAPLSYVRTNTEGTLNVLEAARQLGIERVVHTSTSEVYGTALRVPIDEDHPLQGQSPYSASKIGADKIAESYFRSFTTPVVTLRPFNTYGPRQSARAFIPTVISQALEGGTVRLGSLSPVRDMTFVSDTVSGFLKAATCPGIEGETINLGTGEAHSIGAIAERIFALIGVSPKIEHDLARERPAASEVMKLLSDNGKASARLDWRPKTTLDDGLKATIAYIDANKHFYKAGLYNV